MSSLPFILLVTWLIPNHAPSSYQVEFPSKESCDNAAISVNKEGVRIWNRSYNKGSAVTLESPILSAICVKR
jgi:hypothetical protein